MAERTAEHLLAALPGAIVVVRRHDEAVLSWPEQAVHMLGWLPEEVLNKPFTDLFTQPSSFAHNNLSSFEADLRRKDQSPFAANMTWLYTPALEHSPERYIYIEEVLARSKAFARWQTLVNMIPNIAIQAYDVSGRVLDWNPASERVYGYSAKEAIGKTLDELILPEKQALLFSDLLRKIKDGDGKTWMGPLEWEVTRRDGSKRSMLATTFVLADETTNPIFICADSDVTDLKVALRKSQKNERWLGLALDAAHAGAWAWNTSSNEIERSPQFDRLLGTTEELEHWTLVEFLNRIHPDDRNAAESAFDDMIGNHCSFLASFRVVRPDGRAIWLSSRGRLGSENGDSHILYAVSTDISEYKHIELELREKDALSRRLLEHHKTVRQEAEDAKRRAEFAAAANRAFAAALDYEQTLAKIIKMLVPRFAEVCGVYRLESNHALTLLAADHVDPEKKSMLLDLHRHFQFNPQARYGLSKALVTGQTEFYQHVTEEHLPSLDVNPSYARIVRSLGINSTIIVPMTMRSQVLGVLFLGTITPERAFSTADRLLAEELARAAANAIENARLYDEAKQAIQLRDEFIAVASHELRTPLTPLKAHLQIVNRFFNEQMAKLPKEAQLCARTAKIADEQLTRLFKLIERLLDASQLSLKRLSLNTQRIDLSNIVRHSVDQFRGAFGSANVELRATISPAIEYIGDEQRLGQVVDNLMTNALKYGHSRPVDVSLFLDSEGNVVFRVADRGIGISAADQKRIFDRFERAAPYRSFGGMGLGLYIARQIVDSHGGQISVSSVPGAGSTFTVTLPRTSVLATDENLPMSG